MGRLDGLRDSIAKYVQSTESRPAQKQTHMRMDLNNTMRNFKSKIDLNEMVPGLSQPVWGVELNTVGSYSREGYTSKTFDFPKIPFRAAAAALEVDEDVQYALNNLASSITGGRHYIDVKFPEVEKLFEDLSDNLEFDIFDYEMVKELLWYGNSVYKPRLGIKNVRSAEDLMHIPISSFVHIWWDRQRIPYKYEFRGAEYQGYHNPGEIIHFKWNPLNASAFGTGYANSVLSTRTFEMIMPGGTTETFELPSMIDRKYATQFIMQMAEQRYVSKNVWIAEGANATQRANLQSAISDSTIGQDVIAGTQVEIKELGSAQRNFNADQFSDITLGPIQKATDSISAKAGTSNDSSYANAEQAGLQEEKSLKAFPIAVTTQIANKLFRPIYESSPMYLQSYYSGLLELPWNELGFTLKFGEREKTDLSTEDNIKLIDLFTRAPRDPLTMKLFKKAGLQIEEQDIEQMDQMYNDPMGQMALNGVEQQGNMPQTDMGGGPIFNNQNMGVPPQSDPTYNSMIKDVRGPLYGNQSQDWTTGSNYE